MRYHDAIDRLYTIRMFGAKLGLANTRHLLDALGHPEQRYRIVHVAGTNGKGSVAALVASALKAAGHTVGLFTSPHISSFRERMQVNGQSASEAEIAAHLERLLPIVDDMARRDDVTSPTFFEVVTAMAADLFAARGCDLAVFEVGMGGRLDATNALPAAVSAITSIGLDHTEWLGSTIPEIAFEKAGIIKPGVPVVTDALPDAARDVVRCAAAERRAPLIEGGRDIVVETRTPSREGQTLTVRTPNGRYDNLHLGLHGAHQAGNCTVALGVLESLADQGVDVPREAIVSGVRTARWPGRFEIVPGDPAFILDAAANPPAAQVLAATLGEFLAPGERLVLVTGALRDKDTVRMCRALVPRADEVIVTEPASTRRLHADELYYTAGRYALGCPVRVVNGLDAALETAAARLRGRQGFVLVTGSIFLLARAREMLGIAEAAQDFRLTEVLATPQAKR
ncbi:MAG: bifunctional folylpolyglutamate synthase/dihydrofolate synthase [Verrucomicrobia bacterium]|nr:bifunctional folylpolyglutamate synthase/dihydrofolate synthase [Verrucomicrobiota bacterium]